MTTAAEKAAAQIIEACRYGDPELTITLAARLAVIANGVAPAAVARMMNVAVRLLPGPVGPEGDRIRRGRESESRWAPSVATTLSDRAAVLNNEV